MTAEHPRTLSLATVRRTSQPANSSSGFTLLEIMVVLMIVLIMLKISLPYINNSMHDLHLGASASSLAAAVQSSRYLAISSGCSVQLAVNYATVSGQQTYQVLSQGTPPGCAATFSNYCQGPSGWVLQTQACPIPFSSSDVSVTTVTVNGVATVLSSSSPTATLQFNPSGMVTAASTTTPPVTSTLVLSPSNGGQTKTVNVSGVGYVKVTVP
jgi:prepilin-type N-terminal cleavage/methylation domain-containing protein